MRPVVALVGAFDRFNFGDLLLPHIVRWGLEHHGVDAEFRHFSLRAADLRSGGGVRTEPLAAIRAASLPPGSVVVVVGGEVLSARWLDAYYGLSGSGRAVAAKVAARLLGAGPVDLVARRRLGADRPLPWVVDGRDLGLDLPVLYNAVGGVGLGSLPERLAEAARQRLERAALVTVRDRQTRSALEAWRMPRPVHLAPDAGVLVAELYPRERVLADRSRGLETLVRGLGHAYLVFQVGRYPAWGLVPRLAEELREIQRSTGLGILLLPLGQAPGHDDIVPLRRLEERLRDLPVALYPGPGVSEIVAAVAGAELFIGSSLHGTLTADAYGVPGVAFGSRVAKLEEVLATWGLAGPVDASAIACRALKALARDREAGVNEASRRVEEAHRSLERVAGVLLAR